MTAACAMAKIAFVSAETERFFSNPNSNVEFIWKNWRNCMQLPVRGELKQKIKHC